MWSVPQKHFIVAASETLEAGELLKAGSLRLMEWPVPLPGSVLKVDEIAGRILLFPVAKDQPILAAYLAPAGVSSGLTAKIPSGMRAVSVRSDEVVGVAGFLLPGTHVDVLLTYHSDKSPDSRTATVLQDVVVVAAGQQIRPDPGGQADQREQRGDASADAGGLRKAGACDQPGSDSFRFAKWRRQGTSIELVGGTR